MQKRLTWATYESKRWDVLSMGGKEAGQKDGALQADVPAVFRPSRS
jgi:hypothetical protein